MPCSSNGAKLLLLPPTYEEPPKCMCFQGIRKKKFSYPSEDKASLSVFHWDMVEHVFIFTVLHEGLGKTLACRFALGTNILLHPAPIKEHKKLCLIILIKLTVQMNALCNARSRPDFLEHIVTLPATALCYVIAVKVMICIGHR